jgi:hypothetical protein
MPPATKPRERESADALPGSADQAKETNLDDVFATAAGFDVALSSVRSNACNSKRAP